MRARSREENYQQLKRPKTIVIFLVIIIFDTTLDTTQVTNEKFLKVLDSFNLHIDTVILRLSPGL